MYKIIEYSISHVRKYVYIMNIIMKKNVQYNLVIFLRLSRMAYHRVLETKIIVN